MLADPADTPVTTPAFDTVATPDDDTQVLLVDTTCGRCPGNRAVATSGVVLPTCTDAVPLTVTEVSVAVEGGGR